MLTKNALNTSDITNVIYVLFDTVFSFYWLFFIELKLYKLYSSEDPPPVDLLRNPKFLDMLINYFFEPSAKPNPEHKEKYSYLLAYACSVSETYSLSGSSMTSDAEPERIGINRDELENTRVSIENAFTICHENKASSDLLADLSELIKCLA